MSKAKRAMIESMTPENRNILLLLQMRTGTYMDGETTVCKRVSVIRHRGAEYICPVTNPGIDMDMRPLILNPNGDIVRSVVGVKLDQSSEYVGMLDIMVGSTELLEGMRRASVERRRGPVTPLTGGRRITDPAYASQPKHSQTGMGRISPARMHGETEYNSNYPLEALTLSPEALATIGAHANQESISATKALIMNKAPLKDSEYFHTKIRMPGYVPRKVSFWARMGYRCEVLMERVAESRVGRFFKSLFNR
jgi:hypothetical protein